MKLQTICLILFVRVLSCMIVFLPLISGLLPVKEISDFRPSEIEVWSKLDKLAKYWVQHSLCGRKWNY